MISPSSSRSQAPAPRIVGVIPARLHSTRLPGKVLRTIAGEPMLSWVYRAAAQCRQLAQVIIATDSEEVLAFARSRQWPAMMTAPTLSSGTDRVHALASQVAADIYVNIQGDEPLLRPAHIEDLLRPFFRPAKEQVEVTTLSCPCPPDEVTNPNTVKVVVAKDRRALYFSRLPIPYLRDGGGIKGLHRKHLGLYAYRRRALDRFSALPPSRLELAERLEQLRLLENGIQIYVEPTNFNTIGVDTEEDLQAAERLLLTRDGTRASS